MKITIEFALFLNHTDSSAVQGLHCHRWWIIYNQRARRPHGVNVTLLAIYLVCECHTHLWFAVLILGSLQDMVDNSASGGVWEEGFSVVDSEAGAQWQHTPRYSGIVYQCHPLAVLNENRDDNDGETFRILFDLCVKNDKQRATDLLTSEIIMHIIKASLWWKAGRNEGKKTKKFYGCLRLYFNILFIINVYRSGFGALTRSDKICGTSRCEFHLLVSKLHIQMSGREWTWHEKERTRNTRQNMEPHQYVACGVWSMYDRLCIHARPPYWCMRALLKGAV